MKIKSIFCLVLIALFAFTACGKKGPLEHLKDEKRPKFDKVSDEMQLISSLVIDSRSSSKAL